MVSDHAGGDEGSAAREARDALRPHLEDARARSRISRARSSPIADAYLFTVLNWAPMLKVDLAPWPALQQFQARVAARPAVHAALVAEGLVKDARATAKATA